MLEQTAKDVPLHRSTAQLMQMTDCRHARVAAARRPGRPSHLVTM